MEAQDKQRSVLLIGVQDAGKTNYLFRFWLALDAGGGALVKRGLPTDLDYLKAGADHLLKGEFAPHTPQDVQDRTEIPVAAASPKNGYQGKLVVPDVPGEQVVSVFKTRQWSEDWEDQIEEGCGCLLLVRVDSKELVSHLDWVGCAKLFGGVPSGASAEKDESEKVKIPTQVVMVEWLQFLRQAFTEKVGGSYRPRIGIVVSAWDLAPADQKPAGPERWIAVNLPLLHQFIQANDDEFEFTFFGVSVTEGDLKADKDFRTKYLEGSPRKAGEIVHSLTGVLDTSGDCTLPVAWALGLVPEEMKP